MTAMGPEAATLIARMTSAADWTKIHDLEFGAENPLYVAAALEAARDGGRVGYGFERPRGFWARARGALRGRREPRDAARGICAVPIERPALGRGATAGRAASSLAALPVAAREVR